MTIRKLTICDHCKKQVVTKMNEPFTNLEKEGWIKLENADKINNQVVHFCGDCKQHLDDLNVLKLLV